MCTRKLLFASLFISLFYIRSVAHVGLDFPLGGEVFVGGSIINVQWTELVAHNTENWDLFYSPDNGLNWDTISLDIPYDSLDFNWRIPFEGTTQGIVRVFQDNPGQDYESVSLGFTIETLLPVQMQHFSLDLQPPGQVGLTWITGSEIGNEWFEVQRSNDHANFTTVGKIPGALDSDQEKRYEFIDPTPAPGVNLYRIRSKSQTGAIDFSIVQSIFVPTAIELRPNPVSGKLWISNDTNMSTTWKIIDRAGHTVKTISCANEVPASSCEVSLDFLPSGIYILQDFTGQKTGRTFVKL